jgi:outer membrane protein TolC
VLDYTSTVEDTLLSVSTAYDDVLRAAMQIGVRADEVAFLRSYLHDTTSKFDVGTAPEFDVLRVSAELGNAEAQRVRAIGDHRVAKQRLVELLGYDLSPVVTDDLPLDLTTPLVAEAYDRSLPFALREARENRTEILALEKESAFATKRSSSPSRATSQACKRSPATSSRAACNRATPLMSCMVESSARVCPGQSSMVSSPKAA